MEIAGETNKHSSRNVSFLSWMVEIYLCLNCRRSRKYHRVTRQFCKRTESSGLHPREWNWRAMEILRISSVQSARPTFLANKLWPATCKFTTKKEFVIRVLFAEHSFRVLPARIGILAKVSWNQKDDQKTIWRKTVWPPLAKGVPNDDYV